LTCNKGKVRREEIGATIAQTRVLFLLVDRERLKDVDVKCRNVGNLARDIEEVGRNTRSADGIDPDMRLVDHHVREVWS